ncbi:MAG: nucleotide exchange factor GrpE [Spirochaetaceae bacterium]|jgi:molecular chaperone GrpE|nr:nucleotide exchange factor GrpE [Spirochaetaceae bacterium]
MENNSETQETEKTASEEPQDGVASSERQSRKAGTEGDLEPQFESAPKDEAPDEKTAGPEKQNTDFKDQFLRKAADFENYRKRTIKERQEAIDFANQSLLLDIIPVIDDFERALKAAEDSAKTEADFETLKTGIKMIEQRLYGVLENKWGLNRFDSAGTPFDPSRHEALASEMSSEVKEPTVAWDFMKGYTLKGRVVRPAKVKVWMPENEGTVSS